VRAEEHVPAGGEVGLLEIPGGLGLSHAGVEGLGEQDLVW